MTNQVIWPSKSCKKTITRSKTAKQTNMMSTIAKEIKLKSSSLLEPVSRLNYKHLNIMVFSCNDIALPLIFITFIVKKLFILFTNLLFTKLGHKPPINGMISCIFGWTTWCNKWWPIGMAWLDHLLWGSHYAPHQCDNSMTKNFEYF